jgi:hypothetical protein
MRVIPVRDHVDVHRRHHLPHPVFVCELAEVVGARHHAHVGRVELDAGVDLHGLVVEGFGAAGRVLGGFVRLADLLGAEGLLEDANDVKVFFVKENLLPFKIMVDNLFLLFDGLAPPMRLLKEHLHEVHLTLRHGLHLECHALALFSVSGCLEPRNELVVIGRLGLDVASGDRAGGLRRRA